MREGGRGGEGRERGREGRVLPFWYLDRAPHVVEEGACRLLVPAGVEHSRGAGQPSTTLSSSGVAASSVCHTMLARGACRWTQQSGSLQSEEEEEEEVEM